ncbi:MAG: hypothetical protein GWN18_11460, partial [Thermoplasmata archaeon]|nr:hypothetical protein [Thermoplasmata archaeon]NIT76077.1 hypothetical protein [Thermoplasmata archaeon]NIU49660.1 hypothetical protein [Thermoplasmata archaeon]NIV79329.1 hypothetical protein [Thermoplasmata archaeon]NIW83158.1 hypothetical protein [Thermoplasmata archaeon]
EGYSDSKLEHVVDNPGRVRELLEENVVWLREVSRLPGGEFLKMRVEAPATALNRAATVKRLLPRVDGPIGELREVERVARAVDDSVLELRELSGRIGVAFDRLEAHLSGRAEELSRRVG